VRGVIMDRITYVLSNEVVEYIRFDNKNIQNKKKNRHNIRKQPKKGQKKWSLLSYAGETELPRGIDPID